MGLTSNQMELIRTIEKAEMQEIKKAALLCLEEDTTQKNKNFCKHYITNLKNQPSFIELPYNISKFAIFENVDTFNENRYFLSERESEVMDHIETMNKVSTKMKELGINYINATLLHGESGTGKTTFGKYVAKKMNRPFLYLNFSNLIDSLLGGTAKNISKIFEFAKNNRCVLMLDELDCISINRSSGNDGGASGEISRTTISLMQELDKLSSETIIIGATNRIDIIGTYS